MAASSYHLRWGFLSNGLSPSSVMFGWLRASILNGLPLVFGCVLGLLEVFALLFSFVRLIKVVMALSLIARKTQENESSMSFLRRLTSVILWDCKDAFSH